MMSMREYTNPFSKMAIAPANIREILKPALKRSRRITTKQSRSSLKNIKQIARKRVEVMSEYLMKKLSDIYRTTPYIPELHPFYRELAQVLVDVDDFRKRLAKLKSIVVIVGKIREDSLKMIKEAEDKNGVIKARRAFLGRVLSLLEDIEEDLKIIRDYQLKLKHIPDINPTLPTIVVAGPPNVGKSSFVKKVSTAKPEVREYPFTTKSLILGHVIIEDLYIQVLDTPGLLDRPLSERNKIELQAILALKHLASVIVFLIDPSQSCGYSLKYQVNVYYEVSEYFREVPMIVCLNKVDIAKKEDVELARKLLNRDTIEMSVLEGINVKETLLKALSHLNIPEYYLEKLTL